MECPPTIRFDLVYSSPQPEEEGNNRELVKVNSHSRQQNNCAGEWVKISEYRALHCEENCQLPEPLLLVQVVRVGGKQRLMVPFDS